MNNGSKYLAAAIVFATLVLACLYRYEFIGNGSVRNDRWTGRSEIECSGEGWKTPDECHASPSQRYEKIE